MKCWNYGKGKQYILTKNENWDGQGEVIGSLFQKVNNNNNNNNNNPTSFRKYGSNIPGKYEVKELHKPAILDFRMY